MKNLYLSTAVSILLGLVSLSLQAQGNPILLKGRVLDETTGQPIEFATIMTQEVGTGQLINGGTSGLDGNFEFRVPRQEFWVEISFMGYETRVIKEMAISNGQADLGAVRIGERGEMLDEVVVRAEKSTTEFKLDKRVFNVGQDLSSSGASALEVLNNVPSVSVDIEGQISLRGSNGVQILIDGKPSILADEGGQALGSITADMIERVEVITNPSAKYDAEGTAGIINIVLRKEEKKGVNGSVSVNTGIPHNHSVGFSMNRRTQKFNLFTQLGLGYRELPNAREQLTTQKADSTSLLMATKEYRNEEFYNIILGTDYHISPLSMLTLSGSFAYEIEDQPSTTSFIQRDALGLATEGWQRTEETEATNPKWQYELQYSRDFKDNKDRKFLASAQSRFFGKEQSSYFSNRSTLGGSTQPDQQAATEFQEANYTFKADYTHPFSKKMTLETGAQYFIQDVSNEYEVLELNNGQWTPLEELTNTFEYDMGVLGVYATGAYEHNKWGLKAGLRLENTNLNTLLVNTNRDDNQNYTNLFPSIHASYKFTQRLSMQTGYSRRVSRPRLWDLNPFFNVRNNFSIRQGNPELLPEFSDSYEITAIYILDKLSLNTALFHRYTTDVMERVTEVEDGVSITQPENIGTERSTGWEANAKYSPNKWFTLNADFNLRTFSRDGQWEELSFDFQASRWSAEMRAQFNFSKMNDGPLFKGLEWEISSEYNSMFQTVQGEQAANYHINTGLRKKLMDNRMVISLSVRDVLASRIWESTTDQPDFRVFSRSQRGRFFSLGLSYGFGKGEAMEYTGRRRR